MISILTKDQKQSNFFLKLGLGFKSFKFLKLPPIKVKGKTKPIPIFQPSVLSPQSPLWERLKLFVQPGKAIYGRDSEIALIESVMVSKAGIVLIEGDVGIGKTILLQHIEVIFDGVF